MRHNRETTPKYYVYALIDPRGGNPFYIGKGQKKRCNDHEKEALAGVRSRKCKRIMDIRMDGREVEKKIIRYFHDEREAYDFEIETIKEIGANNLTNATLGGRTPAWLVVDNALQGDIQILRAFYRMAKAKPCYPDKSVFTTILRHLSDFAREVTERRGGDWVNKYTRKTGIRAVIPTPENLIDDYGLVHVG
jgi:hypothetical protein